MKCPNISCGAYIARPILTQAGIGKVLWCYRCRRYYDEKGKEIKTKDVNKHNPPCPTEEGEEHPVWGQYMGGYYRVKMELNSLDIDELYRYIHEHPEELTKIIKETM